MFKLALNRINSNSILKSSLAIGVISVLAKLLGYLEKLVLAYYWGTNYEIDVYTLVISIIMSVFLFFRELIEPGFLNVFLKALSMNDDRGAWAFFNKVARWILVTTILLSVLVFLFTNSIIDLFAPGFRGEKRHLTISILRYAFPSCILLAMTALTNITLNGQKKFALPASGDLAFKLVMLLCLIFLFTPFGIYSVVYGLIFGALIKLIVHSISLFKNYTIRAVAVNNTYVKDAWVLTWPLLLGVTFSQISSLIDNVFASYMKEGAISALSYSKKIIELPILVFPYILSVVIFPYFSELFVSNKKERLSGLLLCSLGWIVIVFIPLSVFFYMFSYELVEIIFKRGAFDAHSTQITAYPLAIYSYGLVFFALETIVVVFYFANSNTKTPILIGLICVIENILLTFMLIKTVGYTGIALGLVISKATKMIVLLYLLKIRDRIDFRRLGLFSLKIILASCTLPFVFYFQDKVLKAYLFNGILNKLMFVSIAFFIGGIVYVTVLWLMRIDKKLLFDVK